MVIKIEYENKRQCKLSIEGVCISCSAIKCNGNNNDKLGCPRSNVRVL